MIIVECLSIFHYSLEHREPLDKPTMIAKYSAELCELADLVDFVTWYWAESPRPKPKTNPTALGMHVPRALETEETRIGKLSHLPRPPSPF